MSEEHIDATKKKKVSLHNLPQQQQKKQTAKHLSVLATDGVLVVKAEHIAHNILSC